MASQQRDVFMANRRRSWCAATVCAIFLVLIGALMSATPALARSARPAVRSVGPAAPAWAASVVAPRDYGLVHGRSVRLVLRLHRPVRALRVTVAGHAVARSFRRS